MRVEQTKVERTPAAERLAEQLRASGAKARPEKEASIAALRALRHLKASVMRLSKGHSSTGGPALVVFPQPLKAYPSQNYSPYTGSTR